MLNIRQEPSSSTKTITVNSCPRKLLQIRFSVETPQGATAQDIRKYMFPVFQRRNAIKMDAVERQGQGKTQVTVFFSRNRDRSHAVATIDRRKICEYMKSLAERLAKRRSDENRGNEVFRGPNGRGHKRVYYKPGQCPYGCEEIVEEDMRDIHRQKCFKVKEYENERKVYDSCEQRLKERPGLFVRYEDYADVCDNPFGFLYGHGPFKLQKMNAGLAN